MTQRTAWVGAVAVLAILTVGNSAGTGRADESAGRVPWRTSRITGSPEPPPPYVARRVFPGATFKEPVFFVHVSALDRFFVGERRGVVYSLANRPDAKPAVAFDLTKDLQTMALLPDAGRVDALYALAPHPRFAENRFVYVCYTLAAKDGKHPYLENGSRISRFTVTATDPPQLDPASEQIVLTWVQGGHNGCDLQFGPDGFLYISTGDARPPSPPDELHTGQDITDLMSSILRIDVDRKDDGKAYAVPSDNPFVGLTIEGKPARPEVWAYGFRNPWRMSFDRQTGQLFVGDVGWELWELVHRVEKGGNYGWSVVEGRQPIHATDLPGPTPIRAPLIELPHTLAASITGGYVYRGKRLPELAGAYVFGDWEFRRMWAARFDGDRLVSLDEITRPAIRVVTFGEDSQGELYFLDYDTGLIYELARNDGQGQNKNFPRRLSETGLFQSAAEHKPTDGVVPFAINAPQWHDGASAERWLALPEISGISVYPGDGKPMPSQVYWHNFRLHFPRDAVLVKTLSIDIEADPKNAAGPPARRRVETQVLHFDGADWRAYSYAWRDDQSDADLVPAAGDEKVLAVHDSAHPLGKRELTWRFHDRTQCLQCHSQWPQYAIGFNLAQLNRPVADAHGTMVNQLVALGRTGHLRRVDKDERPQPPYDDRLAGEERRLADPSRPESGTLDARARAYLHANCSHCHRFNGGGVVGLDLLAEKPLAATRLLERPIRGDFGLGEARVVAPGHPERSTLYYRMAKFGRDRMPHVGSEWPDEAGLRLIEQWIREMPPGDAGTTTAPTAGNDAGVGSLPPERQLDSAEHALNVARRLGRRELSSDDQARVLAAVAQLEPGPVRDLFEGYLPGDPGARKLGPRPRPSTILNLTGDVERGRTTFFAMASKCATCHKVGEQGVNLGPELTKIAAKRTRDELLDSLLNPSRTVEPQYAAFQLQLHDGRSLAGLLVRRDARQVVLRDAQNKEHVLAASDVERITPSRTSLMPDGQLAYFTPQEAADLLAYLSSLK